MQLVPNIELEVHSDNAKFGTLRYIALHINYNNNVSSFEN